MLWLLIKRHYFVAYIIIILSLITGGIFLSIGNKAIVDKDSIKKEFKTAAGKTFEFYTFKYRVKDNIYFFKYSDFKVCSCNRHPIGKLSRISWKLDKKLEKGYFRVINNDLRIGFIVAYWFLFGLSFPLISYAFFNETYHDRYEEFSRCNEIYGSRKEGNCSNCKYKLYCKYTEHETPLNTLYKYWRIFLGHTLND